MILLRSFSSPFPSDEKIHPPEGGSSKKSQGEKQGNMRRGDRRIDPLRTRGELRSSSSRERKEGLKVSTGAKNLEEKHQSRTTKKTAQSIDTSPSLSGKNEEA